MIRKFNCLPKKLTDLYSQMENVDSGLPKFTELPEDFERNTRTKGTHSKRKAILMYIQQYELGVDACLAACDKMSTLQVYEQLKKVRHQ